MSKSTEADEATRRAHVKADTHFLSALSSCKRQPLPTTLVQVAIAPCNQGGAGLDSVSSGVVDNQPAPVPPLLHVICDVQHRQRDMRKAGCRYIEILLDQQQTHLSVPEVPSKFENIYLHLCATAPASQQMTEEFSVI